MDPRFVVHRPRSRVTASRRRLVLDLADPLPADLRPLVDLGQGVLVAAARIDAAAPRSQNGEAHRSSPSTGRSPTPRPPTGLSSSMALLERSVFVEALRGY